MKKNEKNIIFILIVITIVVIIIAFVRNNNKIENETKGNEVEEKYVDILEDGTKLNNSKQLQKEKKIDGLDITNLQLTEKDNLTVLLGTITNNTGETKGDYFVNIKILDENGNEIETVTGYIGEIKAGGTSQLNCGVTADYANAYDFEITKK